MTSLDLAFISALVDKGKEGLDLLRDKGFQEIYLEDKEVRKVLTYIKEFNKDFSEFPAKSVIEKHYGSSLFVEYEQGLPYICKELADRNSYKITASLANQIGEIYKSNDSEDLTKGVEKVSALVKKASKKLILESSEATTHDIRKNAQERYEWYEERKKTSGITGIHTAWPELTQITRGWQRGSMYIFLAAEGVGKTFQLIIQAMAAYNAGERVLLCTEEMPYAEIMARSDAYGAKISYGRLLDGSLNPEEEERFLNYLKELEKSDRELFVNEGGGTGGLDYIREIADDLKPSFVCVDTIHQYAKNTEVVTMNLMSRELKQWCMQERFALLISSHLSEDGRTKYSKAFDQDCSGRFVLSKNEDYSCWGLYNTKNRFGESGKQLIITYDFDTMNFDVNQDFMDSDSEIEL